VENLAPAGSIGFIELAPAPFDEQGNYLGGDWTDPDYLVRAETCKQRILADAPGGRAAAEAAIAWAYEAGLRPLTAEEIMQTLRRNDTFVEEVFFALLNQLGLAIDEVRAPSPPAPVDVLRQRLGHRLVQADLIPHRRVRGERLTYADLRDLRLGFEGLPAVAACACQGAMFFRPDPPTGASGTAIGVAVPASPLTDAATIRQGVLPFLKGLAFRFGDDELYLVVTGGRWLAAVGAQDFQEQLGSDDQVHVNSWLSQWP
jgi:hypothetical protein